MSSTNNILVTGGLSDKKILTKLEGLIKCSVVDRVYLIRHSPLNIYSNKLININPPNFIKHYKILFETWRLFKFFYICLKNKIDILYAIQLIPHSFHCYIISSIFNKPLILSVIGDDIHIYFKKKWIGDYLKLIVNKADIITVLGPESANLLKDSGINRHKIIKLLNYIDETKYQPVKTTEKRWDLIFTGDLVKIKSLDTLINAFYIASEKKLDLTLCIVGDGPEKEKLKKMTSILKISDKVDFINKTSQINKYLIQSKILIMTSQSEALPASAIEASFCGLPVILPDIGDISGTFQHNVNSLMFSSGDIDELVSQIINLTTDPQLYSRLRTGALKLRSTYIKQWNINQQAIIWEKIIKNVRNLRTYS